MRLQRLLRAAMLLPPVLGFLNAPARGNGNLKKMKHVIFIMQENHSFDNHFGAGVCAGQPVSQWDWRLTEMGIISAWTGWCAGSGLTGV